MTGLDLPIDPQLFHLLCYTLGKVGTCSFMSNIIATACLTVYVLAQVLISTILHIACVLCIQCMYRYTFYLLTACSYYSDR